MAKRMTQTQAVNICHFEKHPSQQRVLTDCWLRDAVTLSQHTQGKKAVAGSRMVVKHLFLRMQKKKRI